MLSYLSVICNNEFSDVTIAALEKSRAVFPLPVIYICPPNCSVPTHLGYKVIHLDIDYKDYSEWMIKELHNYIDVAHVITIQYDSCVINKDFWSDVYLSYDYIGAPWPNAWSNRVGNGGFSLRSYEYARQTAALNYIKTDHKILNAEDYFACVTNYRLLCNQGIRFAPLDIARRFCVEHPIPEKWHDYNDLSTYDSFAFHSIYNTAGMKYINE